MVTSILAGSAGIQRQPFPQFQRASFPIASVAPVVAVKSPSIDYREDGFYELDPGDWGDIRVDHWAITLYQYVVADGTVLSSTPYTMAAGAARPAGQFPSDAAGTGYRIGVVCVDTKGRESNAGGEIYSDGVIVIAALHDPLNISRPTISTPGGATDYGVTITRVAGAWENVDTLVGLWQRAATGQEGEVGSTYVTTIADVGAAVRYGEYPAGRPDLVVYSDPIVITSSDIVQPAYLSTADIKLVEIAPSAAGGKVGTRELRYGTNAGGSALSYDSAAWDLVYKSSPAPISDVATTGNTLTGASGSVPFATELAVGTLRYHGVYFRRKSNPSIQYPALDPAATVTIDGTAYPPLTVKIVGDTTGPTTPDTITPLDALGVPPSGDFLTAALAKPNVYQNGKDIAGTAGSGCFPALGLVMLKGSGADQTNARNDLVRRVKYFMATGDRMPALEGGGFNMNSEVPMMLGIFLCRLDATAWAQFDAATKAQFDALWDTALLCSAYTASDTNPDFSGPSASRVVSGKPSSITAPSVANLKKGNPNLSTTSLAMFYLSVAWFGSIATAKAKLATLATQAGLDALRSSLNAKGMTEPYRTLVWRTLGQTGGNQGFRGGNSADAPTDPQILAAITNPRWYGYRMFEDYERVMRMMTSEVETFNSGAWETPAWVDGTIAAGWRGKGCVKSGTDVVIASSVSVATSGRAKDKTWHPKYEGQPYGPNEIFDAVDEGPRSEFHYTIEGGRPQFCGWLGMFLAGLINVRSSEIQPAILAMHRAYQFLQEVTDGPGWLHTSHDKETNEWPQPNYGPEFIFKIWLNGLGPAMGCGTMLSEAFGSAGFWAGFGADGKSVSGGKAVFAGVAAGKAVSRSIPAMVGKYVEVAYTVSGRSSGDIVAELIGGTTRTGTTRAANGTFTERLLVNAGNNAIQLRTPAGCSLSLDDVIVSGPFDTATVGGL